MALCDPTHRARMPHLQQETRAFAMNGFNYAPPRRKRRRLQSPHHRLPVRGWMIRRGRLTDDETDAACCTAAHVFDHFRRRRPIVHEPALHSGYDEPVAHGEAADANRREENFKFGRSHEPLSAPIHHPELRPAPRLELAQLLTMNLAHARRSDGLRAIDFLDLEA